MSDIDISGYGNVFVETEEDFDQYINSGEIEDGEIIMKIPVQFTTRDMGEISYIERLEYEFEEMPNLRHDGEDNDRYAVRLSPDPLSDNEKGKLGPDDLFEEEDVSGRLLQDGPDTGSEESVYYQKSLEQTTGKIYLKFIAENNTFEDAKVTNAGDGLSLKVFVKGRRVA